MAVLAIAIVCYLPAASSLVVDLAPPSLRGIYLSINSQCWGIGYLIGPPLGGFALDRSSGFARTFWLFLAGTIVIATIVLQKLQTITKHYEIQK
jgi:MFS family permease